MKHIFCRNSRTKETKTILLDRNNNLVENIDYKYFFYSQSFGLKKIIRGSKSKVYNSFNISELDLLLPTKQERKLNISKNKIDYQRQNNNIPCDMVANFILCGWDKVNKNTCSKTNTNLSYNYDSNGIVKNLKTYKKGSNFYKNGLYNKLKSTSWVMIGL